MGLLSVSIVTYDKGQESHGTCWEPGQCFGVATVCKMGPYDAKELTRVQFIGTNYPTCKVCTRFLKRMLPAIKKSKRLSRTDP